MSEYPEVDAVARLMDLAARYGLEELEVEEGGLKVSLVARLSGPGGEDDSAANGGRSYLWPSPEWHEPEAPTRSETARPLHAPLTGTFYRARDPKGPALVEVGSTVEEGQPVGLIEAMKVFSEILAEQAGVVTEFVAQNGRLVQHGEVLLYIVPS